MDCRSVLGKKTLTVTLPENQHSPWKSTFFLVNIIKIKWWIFMGHVSFREGSNLFVGSFFASKGSPALRSSSWNSMAFEIMQLSRNALFSVQKNTATVGCFKETKSNWLLRIVIFFRMAFKKLKVTNVWFIDYRYLYPQQPAVRVLFFVYNYIHLCTKD